MKFRSFLSAAIFACGLNNAFATVSLNTEFGVAFDANNVAVANNTLWFMVVDTGNDGFAGGFGQNQSLTSSLSADIAFSNQTLTVGNNVGGDRIIAMGGFNEMFGAGTTSNEVTGIDMTGLVSGQRVAFYWVPGKTYSGPGSYSLGSNYQIGGIHNDDGIAAAGTGGDFYDAMSLPSDGGGANIGAADTAATLLSGTLPNSRFQAVQVVPEPTVALLGGLGLLALLRRRRD